MCDRTVVFSWYSIQHYVIKFVSDVPQDGGVLLVLYTTLCDKVCQWRAAGRWCSPGTLQHYVIKFVSDVRQVGGFLRVLQI